MADLLAMVSIALTRDHHPRRGKARLRLGIPADLITVHGRHRVSLVDLSESGARLHCDAARIGDGILKWLDYETFGSVVWRAGEEAGLQFDKPLEQAWLLDTREWLPEIARQGDGLRRFARDWVIGDNSEAASARARRRRTAALSHLAAASDVQASEWDRWSIIMNWLRAGKPFILGGLAAGLIAGYVSVLL